MALKQHQVEEIIALVKKGGISNVQIGDKVGCKESTVRRIIKKHKVQKDEIDDLAKMEVQSIIIQNEIKGKKNDLNELEKKLYDEALLTHVQSNNLIMNTTQLLVQKIHKHVQNDVKVEKIGVGKGHQKLVQVGLGSTDYVNLAKAIDQTAITLGIAPRHASTNLVNVQNNQSTQNQHVELTLEEAKKKALELGVPLEALIDE